MISGTGLVANTLLGNRYRLIGALARGGMAEVWEAHDEILDRDVAIKVLHPHLADDPDFVERFRREAIAAARLSHPNVVATYDAGSEQVDSGPTLAWIVMELVRGRTLRDFLLEETLSVPAAVHVAIQIADALEQAHRAGIVHRDIKPANILVCGAILDRNVQVKVTDFGIARATSDASHDLTRQGMLVGTAKYLAPEQVEGQPLDARTDVPALGVVLYEMVCGRPPFKEDSDIATALQHVRSEAVPPRQVRPGIPSSVEDLVVKAMNKRPQDRFASAQEFRIALKQADLAEAQDNTLFVETDGTMAGTVAGASARPLERLNVRRTDETPTPPHGTVLARRRFVPSILFGLTAAVVMLVIVRALGGLNLGGGGNDDTAPTAKPISLSQAASFDPQGDGSENESLAGRAIDGDATTSWRSDRYNTRQFGNLKSGVGLVVTLPEATEISKVVVKSPTQDWSASVYAAGAPSDSLVEWGEPVANTAQVNGDGTFSVDGAKGGAVLIWITDPGLSNRVEITEILVSG